MCVCDCNIFPIFDCVIFIIIAGGLDVGGKGETIRWEQKKEQKGKTEQDKTVRSLFLGRIAAFSLFGNSFTLLHSENVILVVGIADVQAYGSVLARSKPSASSLEPGLTSTVLWHHQI